MWHAILLKIKQMLFYTFENGVPLMRWGRQWCGIIHYYWWTASIINWWKGKPRLLFLVQAMLPEGFPFISLKPAYFRKKYVYVKLYYKRLPVPHFGCCHLWNKSHSTACWRGLTSLPQPKQGKDTIAHLSVADPGFDLREGVDVVNGGWG